MPSIKLLRGDFNVFRAGYAEQTANGFRPRKDTRPVKLRLPLDWDMDPLEDRNWCFQLHAWRMLQPIWSEFYGRDWKRLKEEILPWIRDWYAYHVRRRKKSAFMWYDMATGLRAQHLALVLHLQSSGLIELRLDEQKEIEDLAKLHIAKLRNPLFISKGNHGIFQLVGLRLLGIVWTGRSEVAGEEAYSSEQMGRLLDSQFGPQGVHVENSPDYHNFALTHFERIRPELFPTIASLFKNKLQAAREVAPWFTLPDGTIAAFGDSEGHGQQFSSGVSFDAESRSKWGDRVIMRNLSEGGYVVIRTDVHTPSHRQEMLIVKGQAITISHLHADHLGFELYAHGQPLFVDSGKFTYDKNKWRSYFAGDLAHNVIGLQGVQFGPEDIELGDSGLDRAEFLQGDYSIQGSVVKKAEFRHRRQFIYRPGERLILKEEIEAPVGEAPVAWFHLAEHVNAEIAEAGVDVVVRGRKLATLVFPKDMFSTRLVIGQEHPCIQGWVSPAYGKRRSSTVVELRGLPSLRAWQVDIHLHEPNAAVTDLLQRPLPQHVQIPFLYSCRSDRIMPRPNEEAERRVVVEYYSGAPESIDTLVSGEFARAGFTRLRSRPEQDGVRAHYRDDAGIRANVLIRPAATYPVRSDGAVGSVYLAFTLPVASTTEEPGADAEYVE